MEKFFENFGAWITKVWDELVVWVDDFLTSDLAVVLQIIQAISTALGTPVVGDIVSFLINLLPSQYKNVVQSDETKFISALDQAITILTNEQAQGTTAEKAAYLINYLKTLPVVQQSALLSQLGSLILMVLDGGSQPLTYYETSFKVAYTKQTIDDGGGNLVAAKDVYSIKPLS
jgi:hypothetical protein